MFMYQSLVFFLLLLVTMDGHYISLNQRLACTGHSLCNLSRTPRKCSIVTITALLLQLCRPRTQKWLELVQGKLPCWEKASFQRYPGHFQGQLMELVRISDGFCFVCCLTSMHKWDVKYLNSNDRANCANSCRANWDLLSVITVAWIPCFPAVSHSSCFLEPNVSRGSPKNGDEQSLQAFPGNHIEKTPISST